MGRGSEIESGLLTMHVVSGSTNHAYFYDANGNVGQMIQWSQSTAANATKAKYEYDPYGNLLSSSGSAASSNDFRFSTKMLDQETGLYYYGYRYYSPKLGRWISRDPIDEAYSWNLYSMLNNDPANLIDALGQAPPFMNWTDGRPLDISMHHVTGLVGLSEIVAEGVITVTVQSCCPGGAAATMTIEFFVNYVGQVRLAYDREVTPLRALKESGKCSREVYTALRDHIAEEYNKMQNAFGKTFRKPHIARRAASGKVLDNPGRTNPRLTGTARWMSWGGKCCIAVGVTTDIIWVATAPEDERPARIARASGSMTGAILGGEAGMWGGSICGPWGAGIGGIAGAIIGGFVGDEVVKSWIEDD
jgi:RHS repeat-associated protein